MLGQIFLISKNDGVHLTLKKFKANALWGKTIKLSGFSIPVTLSSVPPRHPKGQGWPGAEALARSCGYGGPVLILQLRLPVGAGSVPRPRVPLLPISEEEIAFPYGTPRCGDAFINAWGAPRPQ